MKTKNIIPAVCIGATTLLGNCTKQAPKTINNLKNDAHLTEIVADSLGKRFSDHEKIISYNKLLKKYGHPVDNYIIIDKKNCKSVVYSPDGDTLNVSEVAVGRHIGDKRGGGYMVKGAKLRAYTTPGEFTICREGARKGSSNEKLYGQKILCLAGEHTQKKYQKSQVLALHQVPLSPMGQLRNKVLKNKSLKDNRVSFGCVNYLAKSFDKMRKFIKGINTKVYILPEEKGNHLRLEPQKDGNYKFFQTKYRYEHQE